MSASRHRDRSIAPKVVAGLAGLALAAATAAYAADVSRPDGHEARDSLRDAVGGAAGRGVVSTGLLPLPPTIVAHPPAVSTSSGASFRFRLPRMALRSECKLDRGRWHACWSSATYTSIAIGKVAAGKL